MPGSHKRHSALPGMGQMAVRLRVGLQRLAQPALLGQLDRLLENLVRQSTDERVFLDERGRGAAHAQVHSLGEVALHIFRPASTVQTGIKCCGIQSQIQAA